MNDLIKYNYNFMREENVGKYGFKDAEIEEIYPKLEAAKKELKNKKKSCTFEFACLPYSVNNLPLISDKAKEVAEKYDTLVVVGIGGSDLGTKSAFKVLGSKNYNTLKFLGETTDPHQVEKFLDSTDLSRTCFNFVSRSGETIEVLSFFHFFKEKLRKDQVVVTTGSSGFLRDEAEKEGYFIFSEPKNVSDRFSVLSVVSLFPLSFVGCNINEFLRGASDLAASIEDTGIRDDEMLIFACLMYLASQKRKQNINILMPYSFLLESFGKWYCQLWAESLGKDGKGLTPIDLIGPTDQHSFLQLINDGPKDKVVTFIKVNDFPFDFEIPNFRDFKGATFSGVLKAEYEATSKTLTKNKVPNGTIEVPVLSDYYLGQLYYFLEISCSYLGLLLEVNPFDQPSVEENKKLIEELLVNEN